jgi:hypothetical protein
MFISAMVNDRLKKPVGPETNRMPPRIARRFVQDVRACFLETNAIKRTKSPAPAFTP